MSNQMCFMLGFCVLIAVQIRKWIKRARCKFKSKRELKSEK